MVNSKSDCIITHSNRILFVGTETKMPAETHHIPPHCPECVLAILDRPEWFPNPGVLRSAKLAYASGLPRLLSSQYFSGGKIAAITLGATIYFRQASLYDPHTPAGLALLAHELKHVEQYQERKLVKFYWHYLQEYLRHRYGKKIKFEAEAYAFQRLVQQQLQAEFEFNQPRKPCLEDEAHTPNLAFIKLATEPFVHG